MANFHEIIDSINEGEQAVVSITGGGVNSVFVCEIDEVAYVDSGMIRIGNCDSWIEVDPSRMGRYYDAANNELLLVDLYDNTEIRLCFI